MDLIVIDIVSLYQLYIKFAHFDFFYFELVLPSESGILHQKNVNFLANNADSNQTAPNDLAIHCLHEIPMQKPKCKCPYSTTFFTR